LILNKLMDVFFAKLPQALSFCRPKFYSRTAAVVGDLKRGPASILADSKPFGHITDVEQTLGFGEK